VGAGTVAVACNTGAEISRHADVAIEIDAGPEVLTGSTRLKAGTSQKMVLNTLSTAAFTRLGKVYENLMVDVQPSNEKLERRARRIVREATGLPEDEADVLLGRAGGSVKMAVVMGKTGLSPGDASRLLESTEGSVRQALAASGVEGRASREP
jgi:N-acetylmuramic acid 6-phosphate etherase